MTSKRVLKKEEQDIEKEENWLLREIAFLKYFQEDVQELFELQTKISLLQKSAESGNSKRLQKNVGAIHELIKRDKHKFNKFRRVLSRGERRRVRYEKKVLGKIVKIEKSLSTVSKKELESLVEQIHVYSARLITELSWRVGKITNLTSQKIPDLPKIKAHLEATSEAGKALVALLERLSRFIQRLEGKIHEKQLTRGILPQIGALKGYLREGVIKTAHVRSVIALRNLLEKKMFKPSWRKENKKKFMQLKEEYHKLINTNQDYLSKVLSSEDLEQLKAIDYPVPKDGTFVFLPGFENPLLAFNLHKLPIFTTPGFLFMAMPRPNIAKVAKEGILYSPMESVLSKKHYYSHKFWVSENAGSERRLVDGLSFGMDNYWKYQGYMMNDWQDPMGAFFIFPMKSVLKEGLILDFLGTIDNYPEIVLKDISYGKNDPELIRLCLVALRKSLPNLLDRVDKQFFFFEQAKKNISFIRDLMERADKNDFIMGNVLEEKVVFTTLDKKHTLTTLFEKKGKFYEELGRYDISSKKYLQAMIENLEQNRFVDFLMRDYHINKRHHIPPLARFSKKDKPTYLDGTMFQFGLDYVNMEKFSGYTFSFMALTLMRWKRKPFVKHESTEDYFNQMREMSPHQLKKLIKRTIREVSDALSIIIKKRYRTKEPCKVDIRNGMVFLNHHYDDWKTLERLRRKGIPTFSQFGVGKFANMFWCKKAELDFFFSKVLPLPKLPGSENLCFKKKAYFFVDGNIMKVHERTENVDRVVR